MVWDTKAVGDGAEGVGHRYHEDEGRDCMVTGVEDAEAVILLGELEDG